MYKLPFKIYDGKSTRECTYEDLWIMIEFMLPYTVYSKNRRYYIWRELIENDIILVIYACLKALNDTANALPHNYLSTVSFVDRSRISVIKCKELHLWKDNKLAKLMMSME